MDVAFVLVFFGFIFWVWLYFPVFTGGMELEKMAKEYTLRSNRVTVERLHEMFLEEADYQHDIFLFDEDLIIRKENKKMKVDIIWRPILYIPIIGKEIELKKHYSYERMMY